MEAEDLLWSAPYLVLAAGLYSLYLWKSFGASRLLARSQTLSGEGKLPERVRLLKQALWKANEKPKLERSILRELGKAYGARGIAFDTQDYSLLIGQFVELSGKGSGKALQELKSVQMLKKRLIGRMSAITPRT